MNCVIMEPIEASWILGHLAKPETLSVRPSVAT